MDLTPKAGYSMADFSEISVTTPSYVDLYGYVYHVANGHECFNRLWTDCNGKKMMPSGDNTKFEMAIADINLGRAGILGNMFPGDAFIYNMAMADGTTHKCARKINIIPKYYPYELKKTGAAVANTGAVQTSWTGSIILSWSVPPQGPSGMTYAVRVVPFTSGCGWNATNYTQSSAGQDATSWTFSVPDGLPASVVGQWRLQLVATDEAGDESTTGWLTFTSAASDQCP